ncbi:DMP19 family protein [Paenibacillus sp. VCA1]|uniref:DMP19 family protein n=1 Tax=Paenibacillus sp. VCA1 TaxID=3039148 RepID=UPI002872833D|nr:DMP19 family protein [Paenibacillus sp. VCA1]MDR9856183.1 DMP19 family protein [Paenibacillus sp. VCA1]
MNEELIEVVIDDSIISSNNLFKIIEPLWWSVNIYESEEQYYKDLSNFTKPQQYVFAIQWYLSEVNNGGHDQFYYNSTGIIWEEVMNGFKEIEFNELYELIKESISRLGGSPSKVREVRQDQLDKYEPDFEDLDMEFYKLESRLEAHLMKYIKDHQRDFYFKGFVPVPKEFR